MNHATREARTLAISAHAAAVAARAVASMVPPDFIWTPRFAVERRADDAEWEADRYWLRLARTLKGRG